MNFYYIAIELLLLTILYSSGLPIRSQTSKTPIIDSFQDVSSVEVPQKHPFPALKKKRVCKVVLKSFPKLSLSNLVYSRRFRKSKVRCHRIRIDSMISRSKSIPPASKTTESTMTTADPPMTTSPYQDMFNFIFLRM